MHSDDTTRNRSRDARREMLEVCPESGTSVLTFCAGDHPEWNYDWVLAEFENFFGPFIERRGGIGVTFALAPPLGELRGSAGYLDGRSPSLAFKHDPSHLYLFGFDHLRDLAPVHLGLLTSTRKSSRRLATECRRRRPRGWVALGGARLCHPTQRRVSRSGPLRPAQQVLDHRSTL